jgi:LysR family glycine cleavage system transcriptional activator
VRQRLVLTEVGRAYVAEVVGSLERLQSATLDLLAHRGRGGVLRLATQPAIGMKWLIPRLGRFTTKHPEILLHLATRSRTPFDFCGRPGRRHPLWPGGLARRRHGPPGRLTGDRSVLARVPRTMKRLKEPEDLARAVLPARALP